MTPATRATPSPRPVLDLGDGRGAPRSRLLSLALVFVLVIQAGGVAQAEPPFSGTIFLDPDIITASDPTTFLTAPYAGQGVRTMFDRRVNDWIVVNAYLFNASFDDGVTAEIQVNPEFGSATAASAAAHVYGRVIGRLPTGLRTDVETVWIHRGTQPFGGGNNNLLIHTGQAEAYASQDILEETLVHEAAHTSLDAAHAAAPGWLAAQGADAEFISTYARDFPDREDVAESFLPYLAVRYRADRVSASLADTITHTIPNRIAYFDAQSFGAYPISGGPTDLIFADGFETGDLSAWDAAVSDAGDLFASAAAALRSTLGGLRGDVDDTAGLYVEDHSPHDEQAYRARFYFDSNGFDPGEGQAHRRTRLFIGFEEGPNRRLFCVVLRRVGGAYTVGARVRLDDNAQRDTGFFPIADGPHVVELSWRRATGPGANDGVFQFWVDGVSVFAASNVDNDVSTVDFVRLGALSVKAGAAGTLFWDEFQSRRQAFIGP